VPRRRPRLKARAAVERDAHILLARHERPDDAFWCLPGGGVDPGEAPAAAAVRELREEAGVDVELDGVIWIADGLGGADADGLVEIVFRAAVVGGEAALRPGAGDRSLADIRWVGIDRIPTDFRPGALRRRIVDAGSLAALPAIELSPWTR
jgi:8-oxo-dGTP pyrophosphatase MutT (NUDIX family)